MNGKVSIGELVPLMQEIFKFNKTFTVTVKGGSMAPLLQDGRDSVTLAECDPYKLKVRDIPLYKREDGNYVLHRIVHVNKKSYIMCGDALTKLEKNVPKENVVAVAVAFQRKGKNISVNSRKYRIFSYLWCATRLVRPIIFSLNSVLRGKRNYEKQSR